MPLVSDVREGIASQMKRKAQPVRVEKELWSLSSKQSLAYDFAPKTYKDRSYRCWRCGSTATFTAEEQKRAYEIRKAYIWQARLLCPTCWTEEQNIAQQLRSFAAEWKQKKRTLVTNRSFLAEWLRLLELHPKYRGRRNPATIAMLRRLLAAGTQQAAARRALS